MATIFTYGAAYSRNNLGGVTVILAADGCQTVQRPNTIHRPRPKVFSMSNATSRSGYTFTSSTIRGQSYLINGVPSGGWTRSNGYEPIWENDVFLSYELWKIPQPHHINALQSALLAQIKGQKVNLAVSLAEVRKTADTVASVAADIYGFLSKLRRGRFKNWRSLRRELERQLKKDPTKALARQWLRYTYGITPTMLDISGSLELLRSHLAQGKVMRVTARKTFTGSGNGPKGITYKEKLSLKAVGTYTIDNAGLQLASSVGATNPALLGWELTPLSFVVDWFVNVGEYLSSLDATVGISGLKYQITTRYTKDLLKSGFSSSAHAIQPMGIYKARYVYYSRSGVYTGPPSIYPPYNPSISLRRALSAISLLRGIL